MVDSLNHFGVCVSASVTLRKTKMGFFFSFFSNLQDTGGRARSECSTMNLFLFLFFNR